MTNEQIFQSALTIIAAIPLWGEPITNPEHGDKSELAAVGEYDLEEDAYNPCCSAESDWLSHAVETARATLAMIQYAGAVDEAMSQLFGLNTRDAGIELERIERARADSESPQDFALRFGEKYGLTLLSEWKMR